MISVCFKKHTLFIFLVLFLWCIVFCVVLLLRIQCFQCFLCFTMGHHLLWCILSVFYGFRHILGTVAG